jgi:hypothetical protein
MKDGLGTRKTAHQGAPSQGACRWAVSARALVSGGILEIGLNGSDRPATLGGEMSPTAVVTGEPGAGKTTLIRRFLESNKSRVVAASRFRAVPGSGDWTETTLPANPSGDTRVPRFDELRQYEAAGAHLVSTVSYDTDSTDLESVLLKVAREGGWDEWIVEADTPGHGRSHCTVCVGRPLPAGIPLTRLGKRVVAHMDLSDYLGLRIDEPLEEDSQETGPPDDAESSEGKDEGAESSEERIELTDEQADRLKVLLRDGIPISAEEPVLHDGYAGMAPAEVIVINIRDEAERNLAEETRRQILGLYRDWDLRYRVRLASHVMRPGVYIANLQEPTDAGTRAAIAQMKRKMRQR